MLLLFIVDPIRQLHAQDTGLQQSIRDSAQGARKTALRQLAKEEARKNAARYQAGLLALKQEALIGNLRSELDGAKTYLKHSLDTVGLTRELNVAEAVFALAGEGIFSRPATVQTQHDLATSSNLFESLLEMTTKRKAFLDDCHNKIQGFISRIDSLGSDSALFVLPDDVAALENYRQLLLTMSRENTAVASLLNGAGHEVQALKIKTDLLVDRLSDALEQTGNMESQLFARRFTRETDYLWQTPTADKDLAEIISVSARKTGSEISLYLLDNVGKQMLLCVCILLLSRFISNLKKTLTERDEMEKELSAQLVFRYPLLSSVMISTNLFQFIFSDPPFLLSAVLWVFSAVSLAVIFRGYISRYWMKMWLIMIGLFVLAAADNLLLQTNRPERWAVLLLSLGGAVVSAYYLLASKRGEVREKAILYFIGLTAVLEAAATAGSVLGRYNFAKTIMIGGYVNVIVAILFLWIVRLTNQILSGAYEVYKHPEVKSLFINFKRVGSEVPRIFYVLLVIGWVVLFGRNFYLFSILTAPVKRFLFEERSLGSYTFSIGNLFLFFLILGVAVSVSRLVSFFTSDAAAVSPSRGSRKAGLGNWLLLVRITIMSLGLFFALAATNIPMDRITIVLGAFSVGVGLGLQSLVNNLVSGLIIAFEKPVNVGDIIEINGRGGVMKSIGFRSSIVTAWDGSDIIIPNGDLLNAHLVNWTRTGNRRRVDFHLNLAFSADLEKTKRLLEDVLDEDALVLKQPAPAVSFHELNTSGVSVKLSFWVTDYGDGGKVTSDLIGRIKKAFREAGIEFPLPQQEIHIHVDAATASNPMKNKATG